MEGNQLLLSTQYLPDQIDQDTTGAYMRGHREKIKRKDGKLGLAQKTEGFNASLGNLDSVGYEVEVIFGPGNVVIRVELQDILLSNYPEDELNWEGNHWTNKGKLQEFLLENEDISQECLQDWRSMAEVNQTERNNQLDVGINRGKKRGMNKR